jgi:hypothetical protein
MKCYCASVLLVALNTTPATAGPTRIALNEAREIAHESLTAQQKRLPRVELVVETKNPDTAKCVVFEAVFDNPDGSVHVAFLTVDMRSGEVWSGPNPPCERVSSPSLETIQKASRARHHISADDARLAQRGRPCCADR